VRLPWLAHDEAPGPYKAIPQYRFNKTKQHTAHATQAPYVSVPCLSVYVFAEAKERECARDRDTEFVCMYVCTCRAPGLMNAYTR